MNSQLLEPDIKTPARRLRKPVKKKYGSKRTLINKANIDAATLASNLELLDQQRNFLYSSIAIFMKLGLIAIFSVSIFKLAFASIKRIQGHSEISSVLHAENFNYVALQNKFDDLFTIGAERRLMDAQDHLIAPNRIRVIWQ